MNSTYIPKIIKLLPIEKLSFRLFFLFLVVFLLLNCLISPLYVFVNKTNRPRDKTMLLYPTTNHFYEMTKKSFFTFFGLLFVIFCALLPEHFLPGNGYEKIWLLPIAIAIIPICIYTQYIITQVFHLITLILSLERFIVYFFPDSEKSVNTVQIVVFQHIYIVYGAFIGKDAGLLLFLFFWKKIFLLLSIGFVYSDKRMCDFICHIVYPNNDQCTEVIKFSISSGEYAAKLHIFADYRRDCVQIGLFPVILLAYEFTKKAVIVCIISIAAQDLVGTPLMIQLS
nr:hypothetical protein C18D4.7 - Caenorhabditis elegans [Caenorhabditis elegans]